MRYPVFVICSGLLISMEGCSTAPKKVFEDDNVAVYKICNPSPLIPVCHQEVVQKKKTNDINVKQGETK